MRFEIKNCEPLNSSPPCLMIGNSGTIIIATRINKATLEGIVLVAGDNKNYRVVEHREDWLIEHFRLFADKLILSN